MDTIDILKVCVRRWYVMLPILLGAAGVCYQLVQAQQTTYTAAASYGWVQPSLTPLGEDTPPNPLGSAGDVLVGEALEAQLNSRETQAELGMESTRGWGPGDRANSRSYDVRVPEFESTYEVRAWGEDEREVRRVVERVIKAAPRIADQLQVRANVPPEQRYEPFVLAPTQVDALPSTGWVKLAIAVMGVGLLMGAAWSIVVDRLLRGRRERRERRRLMSPSEEVAPREAPASRQENGPVERPVERPAPGSANGSAHGSLAGHADDRVPVRTKAKTKKPSATGPRPAARR